MAIVAEHSIGRVWQEEGERNGDAFRLLNGTDPALQIPLQHGITSDSSPSALMCPRYPCQVSVYSFIAIELVYIIIFLIISTITYKINCLKNDGDGLTVHHIIHQEIGLQQEENFINNRTVSDEEISS
uniref:Uncharacterized protein n=1 Tax=Heterorhabditis bacteriophora TaxID=37862 RepID=A0A1I7WXC6_HETBA